MLRSCLGPPRRAADRQPICARGRVVPRRVCGRSGSLRAGQRRGLDIASYARSISPIVPDVRRLRQGLGTLRLAGVRVGDLKVAPFHLLACEGQVWFDQDHVWHMGWADR